MVNKSKIHNQAVNKHPAETRKNLQQKLCHNKTSSPKAYWSNTVNCTPEDLYKHFKELTSGENL